MDHVNRGSDEGPLTQPSSRVSPSSSENSRGMSPTIHSESLHGLKNLSLINSAGKRGRKTDREREESGGRREWSDNEITALISLWRDSDILYDTNHPLYFVQSERKLIMEFISKEMNISLRDVNDKMHSLRTYYCSQRQRTEALDSKCEGSSRSFPRWKFYDQMSFLYESVSNRAAKSSLSSTRRGRKPRVEHQHLHHDRGGGNLASPLNQASSKQQLQQVPYTMMHLASTPLKEYSSSSSTQSSTKENTRVNGNNTGEFIAMSCQQQPTPTEDRHLYSEERYELIGSTNGPRSVHSVSPTGGYTDRHHREQIDDSPSSIEGGSGARKRHRSENTWPIEASSSHYSNKSQPNPLTSSRSHDHFRTIEVPMDSADEIFGHMVACSLGQINDEQEKELLKLEIQKMIYNTRFRTQNGN